MSKSLLKELSIQTIRSLPLNRALTEKILFFGKQGYWPNFEQPRSFSEKINWRKLYSDNQLYVTYSDKLAVRDYVSNCVGKDYLIPLAYSGETITAPELLALGDNLVVKATHDSGSVEIIEENSISRSREVVKSLNESLAVNFGNLTNQWWYAEVPPQIVVERLLTTSDGTPPWDFKFFVLKNTDQASPKIIIEVDYDRNTPNHRRCFYDENRQPVLWEGKSVVMDKTPNDNRPFPEVKQFEEMLQVVQKLAQPFNHVRVDLYYHQDSIYFGELTFSEGGGRSRWYPREFDFHLGEQWHLDPSRGGVEKPI